MKINTIKKVKKEKDNQMPVLLRFVLLVMMAGLLWSGISPAERLTWWLEVFPVLIVMPVLIFTYRRFPLTDLLYCLICFHAIILVVGGHYTYAHVPLGDWIKTLLSTTRNDYDRIGHFAQGFVPAIFLRELLFRTTPIRRSSLWVPVLILLSCLGISAAYELFEWGTALYLGQGADSFLGMQGDPWDTQWDMFTALIGAIFALLFLSHWHDVFLKKIKK